MGGRTVEAALRRSIPAFNADVRGIQTKLENIAYKLRIPQRKPWGAMADDVAAATAVVNQHDKVCPASLCFDVPLRSYSLSLQRSGNPAFLLFAV